MLFTKKTSLVGFFLAALFIAYISPIHPAQAWGFWAHKRINRLAVFTLPPEMIGFYKKNIEYITERALSPDKRRYSMKGEAEKHYIDIDHYGGYPFDNVPRKWNAAVEKFTEDSLRAYGISPWNIEKMMWNLTYAFEDQDMQKILRYSAEMGHYVADGHVPLHTTKNYNGQLTNQKGIHGFWEGRIPELYGENYDYWVGKANYWDNPNEKIWEFILDSHLAVDSVLSFERQLNATFPSDQKYCYEMRGANAMQVYCEAYTEAYDKMLNGMVERRMRQSIIDIGSLWLTAWVNAGQPDLNHLGEYEKNEQEQQEQQLLEKAVEKGKMLGRKHDN